MPVFDIHTHSLSENWLKFVKEKGNPDLEIGTNPNGNGYLIEFGTPSMSFPKAIFDYQPQKRLLIGRLGEGLLNILCSSC